MCIHKITEYLNRKSSRKSCEAPWFYLYNYFKFTILWPLESQLAQKKILKCIISSMTSVLLGHWCSNLRQRRRILPHFHGRWPLKSVWWRKERIKIRWFHFLTPFLSPGRMHLPGSDHSREPPCWFQGIPSLSPMYWVETGSSDL